MHPRSLPYDSAPRFLTVERAVGGNKVNCRAVTGVLPVFSVSTDSVLLLQKKLRIFSLPAAYKGFSTLRCSGEPVRFGNGGNHKWITVPHHLNSRAVDDSAVFKLPACSRFVTRVLPFAVVRFAIL